MTYILGLTGGIASGKSTASKFLAQMGAKIIDADIIAHHLQDPGTMGLKQIIKTFGRQYLNPDGTLNRKQLGNLVFNDRTALAKLNKIMQPLIKKTIISKINQLERQQVKLIVIDMALLFENHYQVFCNQTILIRTTKKRQLLNLMQRNHLSRAQAIARINAQMDLETKAQMADIIINNDGSISDLKQKMLKWLTLEDLE